MTTLYRLRSIWTGFAGAPGYSNHYFGTTDPLTAGAQTAGADLAVFWNTVKTLMPDDVHITIESAVALIEDITGEQTGELALSPAQAPLIGTQTGGYLAPAGGTVMWSTPNYLFGRRVKGRTYLVPLAASASDTGGTLTAAAVTTIQGAATALVAAASHLVVYTRPREAKSAAESPTGKEITHRDGSSSGVTSAVVRNTAAVLRSRRD